jgi:hypothetical protein
MLQPSLRKPIDEAGGTHRSTRPAGQCFSCKGIDDIFKPSDGRIAVTQSCKMTPLPLSGPGARRVESSRLTWRKDGDSAFLDPREGKELDERSCPGRASRLGLWLPPGAGRAGGIRWGMSCRARDRILEADAVEGDAMPYREQSPSSDKDTHMALI